MENSSARIREGWQGHLASQGYTQIEREFFDVQPDGLGKKLIGSVAFWKDRGNDGVLVRQFMEKHPTYNLTSTVAYGIGSAQHYLPGERTSVDISAKTFDAKEFEAMRLYRRLEILAEQALERVA